MKILVVTSEVTFVPENYNEFLESLLKEISSEKDIFIDLVILKNNSLGLPLKALALATMGARHIGFHLLKNSFFAFFKDRNAIAKKYSIQIHYFKNPNDINFQDFVRNHQTDLIINARTRFIYKSKTLKLPKLGAINIHHGLLPDHRGTMCDLWALFDDRPTGFTIHVMDKKIDNGMIIKTVETTNPNDPHRLNFSNLILQSSKQEGLEMANIIKTIKRNNAIPKERDNVSSSKRDHTKNPDFLAIRKMLQKGITL